MDHSSFTNGDDFKPPLPPSEQPPVGPLPQISMILGIVSLVLFSCCPPISFVLAVVGIVLACISRQGGGQMDSKARIGLICSIIALAITVLMGAAFILVFIFTAQSAMIM